LRPRAQVMANCGKDMLGVLRGAGAVARAASRLQRDRLVTCWLNSDLRASAAAAAQSAAAEAPKVRNVGVATRRVAAPPLGPALRGRETSADAADASCAHLAASDGRLFAPGPREAAMACQGDDRKSLYGRRGCQSVCNLLNN